MSRVYPFKPVPQPVHMPPTERAMSTVRQTRRDKVRLTLEQLQGEAGQHSGWQASRGLRIPLATLPTLSAVLVRTWKTANNEGLVG